MYRAFHSTETALLHVINDLLLSLDRQDVSILILLDLSASFDTLDHNILLSRLHDYAGVSGIALDWFLSYLGDPSQRVKLGMSLSDFCSLIWGVPQGSISEPMLFSIYSAPLESFRVASHLHADDMQLYLSFKIKNADATKFKI